MNREPGPGLWLAALIILPIIGAINVLITPPVWLFFAIRQRKLRPKIF